MTTGSNELRERLALLARDVHYALVEDGLCDLHQPEEYNAMRETIRRVLTPERIAALARQEEGRKAVERVMDEGDGYWKPCSGCYESVEGYENTAFPYSDTFRCRPGGGCHECGGLGVVWEQMAFDVAESPTQPIAALAPAQEPAGGATPTPQAAGVSEANFNRAWTAFQVEHGSYKKPLSDEALKAGLVAALTAAGAAPEGLPFTDAVIDKMQDVMAVHGFTVPVRVISDAFRTTMYAVAPNPGAQKQSA